MAYNGHWNDQDTSGASGSHSNHTQVGLFSDPNITNNGEAAGDATHANAARVLRLLKDVYAGYRDLPRSDPEIQIASPNGGENWVRGETMPIIWNSNGVTGNVKLDPSKGLWN